MERMKKQYKAYFIDLDGTFLDLPYDEKQVSDFNVLVAQKINEKKPLIISTGRPNSPFVMDLAKKINAPYVIGQNGAVIVDQKNNLLRLRLIEDKIAQELKNFLEERSLYYTINGDEVIYGKSVHNFTFDRPWAQKFAKKTYAEANIQRDITRFLTFGLDIESIANLAKEIEIKFPMLRTHTVSKGYSLEITNKESTKGIGNEFICSLLNLKPEETLHLGDSGNDISVKENNFNFYAMANAPENIKKMADAVINSYENSGLGLFLNDLEDLKLKI